MHGTERGGRGGLRTLALLTSLISLLAVPAGASAAIDGGLKQLGAGCIVDEAPPPAGCTDVRGMTDIGKMAVSPDGKNVYVPSRGRGAIPVFNRNTTTGSANAEVGRAGVLHLELGHRHRGHLHAGRFRPERGIRGRGERQTVSTSTRAA